MTGIQELSDQLNKLIEDNLSSLTSDTKPDWGMMTPQHMVEHLSLQFAISRGKIEMDVFDTDKARSYKHRLLYGDWSFPKNLNVPGIPEDEPPKLRFSSLEEAKTILLRELEMFDKHYRKKPGEKHIHPLLGALNHREWLQFHLLHCKHHFEQFGLINRQNRS